MIEPAILILDGLETIINFNKPFVEVGNNKFYLNKNIIINLLKLKDKGFIFILLLKEKSNDLYDINNILNSQDIYFSDYITYINNNQLDNYVSEKLKSKENIYFITTDNNKLKLLKDIFMKSYLFSDSDINWDIIVEKILKINKINSNKFIPRVGSATRKTKETQIVVDVFLDETGDNEINTGIGFFDHMLDQIATHGGFLVKILCKGDLHIDDHHTIEDTAISLGKAIKIALEDKRGINRFGFVLPMDETQAKCILDLSGRPYLKFKARFSREKIGDFSCEMVEHFFRSLVFSLGCTLHIKCKGKNDHHKIESLFKVFGRTLRQAILVSGNQFPSSKGLL